MKTILAMLAVGGVLCHSTLADKSSSPKPQTPSFFSNGQRILFLGDSITFDGRYTHHVEAYYLTRYPDHKLDFINLGLPSEGVTGLSEPVHPFPRPNVHERLGRALEQLKPNVVVACYGINDGIYHPFSEERFEAYKRGIEKLTAEVAATGAKLVLLTPPPFDPLPIADHLRGDNADSFSWMTPYREYDKVVERYSLWLLGMNDPRVSLVVDVRTPTLDHLREKRKGDAAYTLAQDGVHCNETGQWLIARSLLRALEPDAAIPDHLSELFPGDLAKILGLVGQRQVLLGRAWMTHVGHKRPQTPEGEPLDSARPKAEALLKEARMLAATLKK